MQRVAKVLVFALQLQHARLQLRAALTCYVTLWRLRCRVVGFGLGI